MTLDLIRDLQDVRDDALRQLRILSVSRDKRDRVQSTAEACVVVGDILAKLSMEEVAAEFYDLLGDIERDHEAEMKDLAIEGMGEDR